MSISRRRARPRTNRLIMVLAILFTAMSVTLPPVFVLSDGETSVSSAAPLEHGRGAAEADAHAGT